MLQKQWKPSLKAHIAPVLVLFLVAFLFSLTTRFSPLALEVYGHDAGIFAGVGAAMQRGRVLYTEIWENKGPLLYFINLLGVSIGYFHGIFFLELITLFLTAIFLYKTSLIITGNNKWLSVFSSLAVFLMLSATLEGGNLSEEYALPFLCAGQYFVIKFLYNNFEIRNYEIILTGACLMAVLLLRINIAALFVAIFLVVVIVLIKNKKFRLLFRIIGFALLGCVIFAAPFFIYLLANNAFAEYFNTAIVGIMGSFTPPSLGEIAHAGAFMFTELNYTGTLYYMVIFLVFFIAGIFTKRLGSKPEKQALIIAFVAFLINTYANLIAAVVHMHYFMTFIPIMIVPVAWMLKSLYEYLKSISSRERFSVVLIGALVIFIGFDAVISTANAALDNIGFTPAEDKISDYVLEKTSDEDFVQFIGGDVSLNYKTQRLPSSKHIHFASGKFTDDFVTEVANEMAQGIDENQPELVIFLNTGAYNRFISHLNEGAWESTFLKNYEQEEVDFDRIVFIKKPTGDR